jgi:hypothetical protein
MADPENPQSGKPITSTRLTMGGYFADIVPGSDGSVPVFHWVVQRVGSPEILSLGQEVSLAHAVDRAHECLENECLENERLESECQQTLARHGGKTEKRRTAFYEFGEIKKR